MASQCSATPSHAVEALLGDFNIDLLISLAGGLTDLRSCFTVLNATALAHGCLLVRAVQLSLT